jgi:hypothetical protein
MNAKPFPFNDVHPMFRIPGWKELLGPEECIAASEMARHFLITGETGSGKSASAVMRLLEGILRYPEEDLYRAYAKEEGERAEPEEELRPAVLIVDPKQELGDVVKHEARGRRVIDVKFGGSGPVLYLFEGCVPDQLDPYEVVDLILQQSDFFTQDQARTREPAWNLQAAAIIRDFVSIDMWLARRGGIDQVKALWEQVRTMLQKHDIYESFLSSLSYSPVNYFKPHNTLLNLSAGENDGLPLAAYLDASDKLHVPGEMKARIVSLVGLYHSTRSGVLWMANGILADLSSDEFCSCVSVNPIEAPLKVRLLSVKNALDRGDAVVYSPTTPSPIADMVGRCLKSKFFAFAFERENKVRPFFYVVDEAHRFITAGGQDGEQSLLDRCRAYRTGVVLATQSVASLAYRLETARNGGSNALQIILNNCANALYFRTSDVQTQHHLRERIPQAPVHDRPHVIRVRPLTSLPRGSCYALRSDGSWGIFYVHLPKLDTATPHNRVKRNKPLRASRKQEPPGLPSAESAVFCPP